MKEPRLLDHILAYTPVPWDGEIAMARVIAQKNCQGLESQTENLDLSVRETREWSHIFSRNFYTFAETAQRRPGVYLAWSLIGFVLEKYS